MSILLLVLLVGLPLVADDVLFDRPEDPRAWYNAGVAAFMDEQYPQAAAFFEEARLRIPETDAMHDKALFNRGNAHAQAKEYQKALDIFRALEEKNPADKTIVQKRQYLEQLLQQPPESPEQKSSDEKDTKETDSPDDKSGNNKGEEEQRGTDGAQEPDNTAAPNPDDGQQSRHDKKKQRSKNNSDAGDTQSDERSNEKSGEHQEPEERANNADKSKGNHGSQSANQKNERQSALNQRIAAYLDAVDAQGQEAFKADVQHACCGGGSHDKNW